MPVTRCNSGHDKGDYDALRNYLDIDWKEIFKKCGDDVEAMWNEFKDVINSGVQLFIPEVKTFDNRRFK